jgi:hypothetical protein
MFLILNKEIVFLEVIKATIIVMRLYIAIQIKQIDMLIIEMQMIIAFKSLQRMIRMMRFILLARLNSHWPYIRQLSR